MLSDNSGEAFYHRLLNVHFTTALKEKRPLTVNLDGVDGYAHSFIDEAFGRLVYDFGLENVNRHLLLISNEEPHWIGMLERSTYPLWEKRREISVAPKATMLHTAWCRLVDNELKEAVWERPCRTNNEAKKRSTG